MFNKVWGVLRGTAEQRLHNDMGRFSIGGEEYRTGEEGGLFVHYSEFDGVLGYNAGYLKPPAEMINFILEQFARWETGLPPELAGIAEIGCHYALSYIDQYDPYFFVAYSDICETPDCSTHIYKIKPLGHFSHEFSREHIAPFEKIESFVHSPEKATSYFNEFMSQRPSLELFMFSDTSYIEMEIEGSNNEYSAVAYAKDNFPSEFIEAMVSFFPKKEDYFAAVEFATAAGLIWLAGPLGTYFRHTTVEVCNTVQEHGECLVYDYMILSPDAYEKIALPIKTCGCCGLSSFCVEIAPYAGAATIPVCNFCISGREAPVIREATCGSRFCKFIECPNHLFGGQGRAGYFKMVGQHNGQLKRINNGYEPKLLN